MFIVVRESDSVITASSTAQIADRAGYTVYEIDNSEYKPEMVGCVLGSFDVISSANEQT